LIKNVTADAVHGVGWITNHTAVLQDLNDLSDQTRLRVHRIDFKNFCHTGNFWAIVERKAATDAATLRGGLRKWSAGDDGRLLKQDQPVKATGFFTRMYFFLGQNVLENT
jgi:hypothetical protein